MRVKGTFQVLLVRQAVNEDEYLLGPRVAVEEGHDTLGLVNGAVSIYGPLNDGGAASHGFEDAYIQFLGIDRIFNEGGNQGAVHARCRLGAGCFRRGWTHLNRPGIPLPGGLRYGRRGCGVHRGNLAGEDVIDILDRYGLCGGRF